MVRSTIVNTIVRSQYILDLSDKSRHQNKEKETGS